MVERRNLAGMTQKEAAKKLGVSISAIAQWDTGRCWPKGDRLPEVAKLYNCTIDELLETSKVIDQCSAGQEDV